MVHEPLVVEPHLPEATAARIAASLRRGEESGLRLVGELDLSTVEALRTALDGLPRNGRPITLDLADLAFIDAGGLRALEEYAQGLNGSPPVVLDHVSDHIRQVFEITGVDRNPAIEIRGDHGG